MADIISRGENHNANNEKGYPRGQEHSLKTEKSISHSDFMNWKHSQVFYLFFNLITPVWCNPDIWKRKKKLYLTYAGFGYYTCLSNGYVLYSTTGKINTEVHIK